MKDKIIELKTLIKEYNNLYNEFENKKTLFNLKVDDLCEEYECGLSSIGLTPEEVNTFDNYKKAKYFFTRYSSIIVSLNNIRGNNINLDRNKLNFLCTKYLTLDCGFDYTSSYLFVRNYSIFMEACYYKTVGYETALDIILQKISDKSQELKQLGVDSLDLYLGEIKARFRPYAEETLNKVKPIVHQGSKTLAKVFTKIADKTQKKNDYRLI